MAFSEIEAKRCEKLMEAYLAKRRPPAHIRAQLDIGYRITGQSIEIFEIRPLWSDPSKKVEESVAKTTYLKTRQHWKVFWQRADLNWHSYEPAPTVDSLEEFLELVEEDASSCFWG